MRLLYIFSFILGAILLAGVGIRCARQDVVPAQSEARSSKLQGQPRSTDDSFDECVALCLVSAPESVPEPSREERKESCHRRCTIQHAVAKGQPSVCATLAGGDQSTCYHEVAVASRNAELCRQSYDSNYCLYLIGGLTGRFELCEEIAPPQTALRDDCFAAVAIKTHNPAFCDRITAKWIKKGCQQKLRL